jgi:hypothetical protein
VKTFSSRSCVDRPQPAADCPSSEGWVNRALTIGTLDGANTFVVPVSKYSAQRRPVFAVRSDHKPITRGKMKCLFWILKADDCPALKNKHPFIPRLIVPEFMRGWPDDVMRSMRNDFDRHNFSNCPLCVASGRF